MRRASLDIVRWVGLLVRRRGLFVWLRQAAYEELPTPCNVYLQVSARERLHHGTHVDIRVHGMLAE